MKSGFTRTSKAKIVQYSLVFLAVFCIVRSFKPVSNYRLTQWLFNYDESFLKRGLPGTFLRWLDIVPSKENLIVISFILFGLVTVFFGFAIYRAYKSANHASWAFTFLILALINPGTLPHFAHDIGRFDGVGLILFICGLLISEKASPAISLMASLAISIVMLLVHEAFFFVYIPPLLAFWILKTPNKSKWIWASGALLAIFVATYLVSTHGVLRTDAEFNTLLAKKQSEVGSWVDPESLVVIKSASLKENFELTLSKAASLDKAVDHLKLFLLLLLPMYLIFGDFVRRLSTSFPHKIESILLYLSLFSALALYPLGYDHFRWWALILTNFFVVTAFILKRSPTAQSILAGEITRHKKAVVALIVLSAILGPLSTYYAFQ